MGSSTEGRKWPTDVLSALFLKGAEGMSVQVDGDRRIWSLVRTSVRSGLVTLGRGEEMSRVPARRVRILEDI